MPAVINSSAGGDLDPGFAGGGPVATAVAVVRQTMLSTSLGDALNATVSYGWDQVAGTATIVAPASTRGLGDGVVVTMGAGVNNVQRFAGRLVQPDSTLAPHSVSNLAKGPLSAIEEFENGTETTITGIDTRPGLRFADLVGSVSGATLRQIVVAVLTRVGVSFSLANFENPSHVYGQIADEQFTWGTHDTASAYLHRILEASAGYRLFDSSDGNVYLKQITPIANAVDPDFQFTLSEDIFGDSTASTSSIGVKTGVLVEGFDFEGLGAATSHIVGSSTSVFRVSSPLIETDAFATEIANYWLPVVNRPQRIVRLTTPLDYLLGPGQTIYVNAARGLGVDERMFLKSFSAELAQNGQFTQHLVCVASPS